MKVLAIFVGLCLVFAFVGERVDVVRVGYQIERLKHDKMVLERQRDELRVKVSALSAPERIAHMATERLGMTLPQHGQIVMVQLKPVKGPSFAETNPREVRLAKNEFPSVR